MQDRKELYVCRLVEDEERVEPYERAVFLSPPSLRDGERCERECGWCGRHREIDR